MNRYCKRCGGIDVNECITETTPDPTERNGVVERLLCPFCGRETVEANFCQCGRVKDAEMPYCTDCFEDVETDITDLLNDLLTRKHFRPYQAIDIISIVLDEKESELNRR